MCITTETTPPLAMTTSPKFFWISDPEFKTIKHMKQVSLQASMVTEARKFQREIMIFPLVMSENNSFYNEMILRFWCFVRPFTKNKHQFSQKILFWRLGFGWIDIWFYDISKWSLFCSLFQSLSKYINKNNSLT